MEVISFQWRLQTILIACAKKLQHVNFCGFVTRYNTFFNRKQLQKCFQIARSFRLVLTIFGSQKHFLEKLKILNKLGTFS